MRPLRTNSSRSGRSTWTVGAPASTSPVRGRSADSPPAHPHSSNNPGISVHAPAPRMLTRLPPPASQATLDILDAGATSVDVRDEPVLPHLVNDSPRFRAVRWARPDG